MMLKKQTLGMIILFLISSTQLQAQMDTTKIHHLSEIQVIAKQPQIASDALRVITTITSKEIQAMPVQSINELLDYLPNVDIRTRGANGAQADISIRGGTFDQVLILLNGVNITDPRTGHANLDLPIDLNMIDRIEVLQGTSMNLFG
ncbi:MAG TPA: Plug domain-containing protein, partial [Paludibacteraceae bacterium]|nr:Plug domain-containing protein [Paludibacteraceae bacterium]